MPKGCMAIALAALFAFSPLYAQNNESDFNEKIKNILSTHFKKYKEAEYFTGVALSIELPNQAINNYYIGRVSHAENSKEISKDTLFQIGSNTKSFTAAIILQLEKENKLTINDHLEKWLPQYNKWSIISVKQLLNMTSGIPNYSDLPLWSAKQYHHPGYVWTKTELVNYAYPPGNSNPPLKQGFFYSNTAYMLAGLIVEKVTNHSFTEELRNRTIKRANLTNTFYSDANVDKKIQARLAIGYNYNQYDNPWLVGKEINHFNLSWAGAAGGVISNTEDLIKWTKALFVDNNVLEAAQQNELTQLVSNNTGEAIQETTIDDPKGFGLGVAQLFDHDMGRIWFYEGETLGFRALFMYKPCNGIIISSIFNSATNSENDHAGELLKAVYKSIIQHHPNLSC
ncbi:MAG: hypothetical protein ACD_46C00297G0003 [uncultured bacterium]|nr:MAG: hypothetical protein ACD_46C00297G0003 [uncultured bacterium]